MKSKYGVHLEEKVQVISVSVVWTPVDFLGLGNRDAVDKTLQRLVANADLRRMDCVVRNRSSEGCCELLRNH